MTAAVPHVALVVTIGPATVRAARGDGAPVTAPDAAVVAAALDAVDDAVTLLGDDVVAVPALWRAVIGAVTDGVDGPVTLVFPAGWTAPRRARVLAAARGVVPEATEARRPTVLADLALLSGSARRCVVEVGDEAVVVCGPDGGVREALMREDCDASGLAGAIADAAVALADDAAVILLDRPDGVAGAHALAATTADRLRAAGRLVAVVDGEEEILRPDLAGPPCRAGHVGDGSVRRRRPAVTWGVAAALAVAVVAAVVVGLGVGDRRPPGGSLVEPAPGAAPPPVLAVEGRVALQVPADWVPRRVRSGGGSPRVAWSPPGGDAALWLTQAPLPSAQPPDVVIAALHDALAAAPAGAFGEVADTRGPTGRAGLTYREQRAGAPVQWTVFVDATVRIGIGCAADRGHEAVCDAAVDSARAVAGP